MYKIEIEVSEIECAEELIKLADENDNIDVITDKNFNGDITTIELYISLALNVVTVIVPIVKAMIKQNKVSSLKIDGDKIELENVSQKLIEQILVEKGHLKKEDTANTVTSDTEVSSDENVVNNLL